MNNLVLADGFLEEEKEQRENFKVTDMASADWCFRKIASIRKDLEEKISYADFEIAKYVAFKDNEKKSAEDSISFFESLLIEYYEEQKAIDDKFKLKTAQGSLVARNTKSYKYEDEKVIAFLKENDFTELIRIKEEIDKTNLKKQFKVKDNVLVTEDGEIVDGVIVEDKVSYSIKEC